MNTFMLGPIVSFYNNDLCKIIHLCLTLMALCYMAQAAISYSFSVKDESIIVSSIVLKIGEHSEYYLFVVINILLSMFSYMLATVVTSLSTTLISPSEKGTLLGLEHSLFAAARVFSPQMGVFLMRYGGTATVSAGCFVVYFSVILLWQLFGKKVKTLQRNIEISKTSNNYEVPRNAPEKNADSNNEDAINITKRKSARGAKQD
jgi:hypothetical protein